MQKLMKKLWILCPWNLGLYWILWVSASNLSSRWVRYFTRCGLAMYLIHGWLITKEDIIGLPRLKINLDSLEEEPNSYMEQINTWIRFLMFALIIFKIATNFVITLTLSRATYFSLLIQVVPDIAFGSHTRVVLDVGCRVASFGAYLLSRDVLTLSIATKDVHENQIQFALERGVPAMVAAFATHQLLYPSQTFDIIHCLRCRINWTHDDEEGLTGNAACHWYVSPDIAEAQFEPISRIILRDHGPVWFTTTGSLTKILAIPKPRKSIPDDGSYRCSSCICRAAKPRTTKRKPYYFVTFL